MEQGGVFLTWISHIALGAQLSGRCFILGNILVIEPQEREEEAGFLKLEFYEQLRKLPAWTKTTYYCFASSIRKIDTGRSLARESKVRPYIPKIDMTAAEIIGSGSFRLGRYRIIVDGNNVISWQSIGELNRIVSGKCVIESGIIFIGQKEIESDNGQDRREFFAGQRVLPQWNKTFAWGYYGSLRICKKAKPWESYAAICKPKSIKIGFDGNMPFIQKQELKKEKIPQLTISGYRWLITAWCRVIEWNGWGRIKALIIAGIFLGSRIFVLLIEKIEKLKCLTRGVIARFRRYRNK